MDVIRQNRLIASILGGLVVVSLLVLLLNDGSSTPAQTARPSATSPTGPAPTRTAAPAAIERPDFEKLDCGPLLSRDGTALALDGANWSQTSAGEYCVRESLANASVFVRLEPGHPDHFRPGATLRGVTAEAVTGVGDAAVWFGGPQAQPTREAGSLTVATVTDLGTVVFQVVIGRPDLDGAAQLELAKTLALDALPRFPGVDVTPEATPTPEPRTLTIEHDPVDRSGQSFVEHLLAQEADGEWSRGEGLVATLRLLAGELPPIEVLRDGEVLDQSGSGIVRMARAYLEGDAGASDANATAEIERLLELLLPRLEDFAPATSAARADGGGFRSLAVTQQANDDCFFPFPDHGNPCFLARPVDNDLFGEQYRLLFPDLDEWEGWVRGPSTIQDAIVASAITLEGLTGEKPGVEVWLTPWDGWSLIDRTPEQCSLYLASGAQALTASPPLLEQAVASAMARCYIAENFGLGDYETQKWWEDGLAWYLSDVIYPDSGFETFVLDVPGTLSNEELSTTLLERSTANMPFFEFLDASLGLQGTVDAAATMQFSGPGSIPQIDELLHGYTKALTDGAILDQSGVHPYPTPGETDELTPGLTIAVIPQPFGLGRVAVSFEGEAFACLEYPASAGFDGLVSWRPGTLGEPESGDIWTGDLPASVQGNSTFLVTTSAADQRFDIEVVRSSDNADCEDEDETPTGGGNTPDPCGLCEPSEFFWKWLPGR